jgi:hypothetical protein
MPVNESVSLERDLRDEVGVAVDRVYLNGLYPERFSAADRERLDAAAASRQASPEALEVVGAAISEHGRARAQREQLQRLAGGAHEPATLPHVFAPELGRADIEALSGLLEEWL